MLLSLSNSIQLRLLQDRCGCLRSSLYPLARLIAFTLFVRFGYIPDPRSCGGRAFTKRGTWSGTQGAVV